MHIFSLSIRKKSHKKIHRQPTLNSPLLTFWIFLLLSPLSLVRGGRAFCKPSTSLPHTPTHTYTHTHSLSPVIHLRPLDTRTSAPFLASVVLPSSPLTHPPTFVALPSRPGHLVPVLLFLSFLSTSRLSLFFPVFFFLADFPPGSLSALFPLPLPTSFPFYVFSSKVSW